ncbi:MAG TPA: VWA domain-containing protein [Bryobacteraceae bacterium]|nr:VWA domain-containing protein [Bryobacteraceae bacterium]
MKPALAAVLVWGIVWAPAVLTCPAQERQSSRELELLSHVQQRMAEDLDRLPDYFCQETIERSAKLPRQNLLFRDRIRLDVAYIGLKEMFAWPGSAKFEYSSPDRMVSGGASGFGSFGSWTHSLFRSSAPVFGYAGEHIIDGRRTFQYNFQVPLAGSTYKVNVRGREAVVPYSGSIWIDPELLEMLRLEVRAGQSGLPVASVTNVIDYARTLIGSAEFLLPQSAELIMIDAEGNEHRNLTRLTGCRQYTAESSISFDLPAAAPAAVSEARELTLPAGITLEAKLESPISFEQSAVGDQITARLDRAVNAGSLSLPKGATLSGRIRRLEQYGEPAKLYIVGLEFSSLALANTRVRFRARLTGPLLKVWERKEPAFYGAPPTSRGIESSGLDIDNSDPLSPYGVFRIWGNRLRLSRGLRMIWETQDETAQPALVAKAGADPVPPVAAPQPVQAARQPAQVAPPPVLPAKPAPAPVIRVTTRLVQVHVLVQDRKGDPISGLTRDDFVLLDEGTPQQITDFSVESGGPSLGPRTPVSPNDPAVRGSRMPIAATAVLFDRLNTSTDDQFYAKRELLKFLRKAKRQERIAIYVLDGNLRVLPDSTDAGELDRALSGRGSAQLDASEPPKPDTGFKAVDKMLSRTNREIASLAVEERVLRTLWALEAVGLQLSRLPGRKNLVWLSGAFPLSIAPELNEMAELRKDHLLFSGQKSFASQARQTTRVLTDANVAVYPVDARGLVGVAEANAADATPGVLVQGGVEAPQPLPNSAAQSRQATDEQGGVEVPRPLPKSVVQSQQAMERLARDTGGRAFYGANDLIAGINRAFEDSRLVYVLGFRPSHEEWDGKFHQIKVQVKQPGSQLRHRRGYFAVSESGDRGER